MELLDSYIKDVEKDLKVDDFNIKEVQMRLPARKHFWVARLMESKIRRGKLLKKRADLKESLIQGIIDESPVRLTTGTAGGLANKHESVKKIDKAVRELEYIIEYLEKVEKVFSTMHWELKNIIDINKMELM